jgi:hypothetical protein
MKLLYRFFWGMVSGNPRTEYILNQIDDRNQIINYAIENRLERPTLDFLIKYKNKKCLINNLLKNANKRNLKSLIIKNSILEISKKLSESNINYVLLKGANFIDTDYCYTNRNLRDIDILIEACHIPRAIKIFEKMGYLFFKKNNSVISDYMNNGYSYDLPPMRNDNGVCIEIHFKIFAKNKESPCKFGKGMLDNKVTKEIYKRKINFCKEGYLILHLIYHGTSKGFFDNGLHLILDLNKMFYNKTINIDELLELATKYNLYKEVVLSLNIISHIKYVNRYLESNNLYLKEELIENTKFLLASKTSKPDLDYLVYDYRENFLKKLFRSLFVPKSMVEREFLLSKNNPYIVIYYFKRWLRQAHKNAREFFKLMTEKDKKIKARSINVLKNYLD